jgi:hypothetical protein
MFLENFGRFLFQKLPVWVYLFIVSFCPISVTLFFLNEKKQINLLKDSLNSSSKKAISALEKKKRSERCFARFLHPSPHYIHEYLESFPLLSSESEFLNKWVNHPAVEDNEQLLQRQLFIRQNRLQFREDKVFLSSKSKDTRECLRKQVEVTTQDLKDLLVMIELEPKDNSPQLLIEDFSLRRKIGPLGNIIYEMNLDLIKREFL